MFETIFIPSAAHKHRLAPLLREREEFLLYLKNRGTGWSCLRVYASRLNQIVRFLRLTKFRVVRPIEIKKAARRWATYHGEYRRGLAGPWSEPTFVWLAKRWLRFHGKLALPRSRRFALSAELDRYADFMRSRGLSSYSVRDRIYQTGRFLRWVCKSQRNPHKHYLGLSKSRPEKRITLLYAYWEPKNAGEFPEFIEHREEVEKFCELVAEESNFAFRFACLVNCGQNGNLRPPQNGSGTMCWHCDGDMTC
jgi:hypothetical protein